MLKALELLSIFVETFAKKIKIQDSLINQKQSEQFDSKLITLMTYTAYNELWD